MGELEENGTDSKTIEMKKMTEAEKIKNGICPSCDSNLTFQEGCKLCYDCGWGGCS